MQYFSRSSITCKSKSFNTGSLNTRFLSPNSIVAVLYQSKNAFKSIVAIVIVF